MKSHAIRTARVPARLSQRHGVRPALEHWLAEADPSRHGLPARAIVLVRRLQAPWASVTSTEAGTRYGTLAAALSCAARPARGEWHGDTVWFADEAELLVCLARDALAGELLSRWWWKLVLRERVPAAARARWLRAVQVAPRALAAMEVRAARTWLQGWTAPEQLQLVQGLTRLFPVAMEAMPAALAGAASTPAMEVRSVPGEHAASLMDTPAAVPMYEGLCRCLLALARDPSALAEPEQVLSLWRGAPRASAPRASTRRARTPAAPPAARGEARFTDRSTAPPVSEPTAQVVSPAPDAPRLPAPTEVPAAPGAVHAVAASLGDAQPDASAAPTSESPPPSMRLEARAPSLLVTEFGGLLFLLNAALQLGLYGDFTQPRRAATLGCSPWRFLLATGRLFGGRPFAADPLAYWLHERAPQRAAGVRARQPGLWRALRERLAQALDLPDPLDLATAVLRLPARIEDGIERVDLHMDLCVLPLPVRLAGLDRDPGWIPAAGCDFRFQFH